MKKVFVFFCMLFAASFVGAQTTIEVLEVKTDSSVLYQFKESTVKDGREVAFRLFPENPIGKSDFGDYIFNLTIPMHQAVQQANAVIKESSASISNLSSYVDSLLGPGTYKAKYDNEVVRGLDGSWTILTSSGDKITDAVAVAIKDGVATIGGKSSNLKLVEDGIEIGKGIFPDPVMFSLEDGLFVASLGGNKLILKQ